MNPDVCEVKWRKKFIKSKNSIVLTIKYLYNKGGHMNREDKCRKRIELSNDYMFATIMVQERELCRRVLETILGFEIESLVYLDEQLHLKTDVQSHAIRLDVVAKNTGAVYDIEMQKVRMGNIPRRARYYQSQIDVSELDKGIEYGELKDSYVIFICGFDLFDM